MEKHNGKTIKILWSNNTEEYKNEPSLELCQNEDIEMHFTVRENSQQYRVAERMNHTLLENVWRLLSNAGLAKSFWAEALTYASHLIKRFSLSAIGGKIPMEVWSEKAAQDYDMLTIFGCPAYYHIKEDKLDPQAKKTVFLSLKKGVKGYKRWDPNDKKIVVSSDVTFDEASMIKPTSAQ